MINWFYTPVNTPILVFCFLGYLLCSSVTSYDIHLLKLQKGIESESQNRLLPRWVGLLHWAEVICLLFVLLLNWKFAVVIWIMKSILQALFILELIGYMVLYPFNLSRESFPEI